jgi:hypothetical protein
MMKRNINFPALLIFSLANQLINQSVNQLIIKSTHQLIKPFKNPKYHE